MTDIAIHCAYDELRDPASLKPNPRNPNTHPKRQIELLAKMIERQGWRAPVTVSNRSGFVVRGHGRLMAALLLVCRVPVDRQDYASDADEWADLVADNRIAELAEVDDAMLARLLAEIDGSGLDLDLTGYSERQMSDLLASLPQEPVADDNYDVDAASTAAGANPRVRRGDVWQLGAHRLMCGDSTSAADVATLMDGGLAAMVFTDPPYNVNYSTAAGSIANDNLPSADFAAFLTAAFRRMAESTESGAAIYVCHSDSSRAQFDAALRETGWDVHQVLVWVKNALVLGRSDYQYRHEPILYGWKRGGPHKWNGGRKQSTVLEGDAPVVISHVDGGSLITVTADGQRLAFKVPSYEMLDLGGDGSVWRFDKPVRNAEHPTMKPIPLCARAVVNSSRRGEAVLDLFGGSGSTLMACEQTGRLCRTMELSEVYASVIVDRWEKYAKRPAERIGGESP